MPCIVTPPVMCLHHRLRADSRHCHSTREIHEHLSADEMTDLFVVLCSSVSSTMHFTSGLSGAHTRPKFPPINGCRMQQV